MNETTLNLSLPPQFASRNTARAKVDQGRRSFFTADGRTSRNSRHPESRFRNPATGEMHAMGFAMRHELFCPAAIEAAIHQPNGLEKVLARIKSSFLSQWGVEQRSWQMQKEEATLTLQRMTIEHSRLTELLKTTPCSATINDSTLPRGAARYGWWGLALSLLILNVLAVTNTASYLKVQTQEWFTAYLLATPLLFVSLATKFVSSKVTETSRRRIGWTLASTGVIAFGVFVYTLAMRADPPSMAAILDGTARPVTGLVAWQLAATCILDIVISAALWWAMHAMMISPSKVIANPNAAPFAARLAAIESEMLPVRSRLAEAEGNQQEFNNSLESWICLATTMFQVHEEQERRLTARIRALDAWPHFRSVEPNIGD